MSGIDLTMKCSFSKIKILKERLNIKKPNRCHENDNRELINLDFYENEIIIMEHKLSKVLGNRSTKKIKSKLNNLDSELKRQKLNLDEFRKNYDVNQMCYDNKLKLKREKLKDEADIDFIKNDENFFQHLQSFESSFKVIREEVLEFINYIY